ncbi:MAG TPA: sugar phosphate nucleotidyltransferase [Patescibacteria group bacterium]|nr:sugar phosphate nucleotidyltransferase [Patescibacteria group bacterium]
MLALIMAGGSGTRLWPLSRRQKPKQLLKFINNETLLQTTFHRLAKGFAADRIFVATTKAYSRLLAQQLPRIPGRHYSIEPQLKDRGPAIALAALIMHHYHPDETFVTAWADHYIKNEAGYFQTLKTAQRFLSSHPSYLVTIGARPDYPHTGFGYIKTGRRLDHQVYQASAFKEKPDLKTAEKFVANGRYLWNTGYFICRLDTLIDLYRRHQPAIYQLLEKIKPYIGTKKQQWAINRFYPKMPQVDIERGLIEKLDRVAAVKAGFDWADIGSWKVIKDVLSVEEENLTRGRVVTHNAKKSLVYNYENKIVAMVGAENLIVVNTKDALLIAPKDKSEEIKELVKKISQNKKLKKYL